ncbi:MAG: threonine/serine exporter family protein [Clostridium sp.]|nr:threonine/serine exporter family protein [Clostridium sp.]
MDLNKLLQIATYAGKIMLESGAETYRVEETIYKICFAFGADTVDTFATPTGIMVSITYNDNLETYSLIKRVTSRGVDLNKVDKVNDLARYIQNNSMDLDTLHNKLKDIDKGDNYSLLTTLLFSAMSAGMFAIVFEGDLMDCLAAFIIGFIIQFISIKFQRLEMNAFFINTICGATSSALAIILYLIGIANHISSTNIGAMMLLVPGLAITNAARDTIAGDYLSGITKAAEAFLVAISIAVGSGAVLSFWINTLGGTF